MLLSTQKKPLLKLFKVLKKAFSSQIFKFLKLFFSDLLILSLSIKRYNFPFFGITSLQFNKGLFGKSFPLIFKSQLTFSLELTYKYLILFLVIYFLTFLIFENGFSPATRLLS